VFLNGRAEILDGLRRQILDLDHGFVLVHFLLQPIHFFLQRQYLDVAGGILELLVAPRSLVLRLDEWQFWCFRRRSDHCVVGARRQVQI
jgi:hypothetical protein